jgi:hypothetical protein
MANPYQNIQNIRALQCLPVLSTQIFHQPKTPFALSLSKGRSWFDAPKEIPWGDKLTTNGFSL